MSSLLQKTDKLDYTQSQRYLTDNW